MKIEIGNPYLENIGEKTRLIADIKLPTGECKPLYYEVESDYAQFLCSERSDAFLLSLMQFAMFYGYDIVWEKPVTEQIVYQLNMMYIPVISKAIPKQFKRINISGPTIKSPVEKLGEAVVTGASGGIDSFYSIMRHISNIEESYKLTHLFFVAISNNVDSLIGLREEYENSYKCFVKNISTDLELPLIRMFSNESEFHYNGIIDGGALRYAGMAYALQKLFSVYYLASGYQYTDMEIKQGDSHHFDLFNISCVSSKSLQFYSSGAEVSRPEKTSFIQNFEVVKKNLHVCNFDEVLNCSLCDKCFRTMMALYADGVLSEFSGVFDLNQFEGKKNKYFIRMFYRKSPFDRELFQQFKNNGKKFPGYAKLIGGMIRPFYVFWQGVQKNKILMKIFYLFKLDYILYDKKLADSIRYSKGIK